MKFSWIFTFFDSRHFQMSSSELKLYFITYYRPLVYFEVFSIYLSGFYEPPKKQQKLFFWIFEFFFSLFSRGGNYMDNSGIPVYEVVLSCTFISPLIHEFGLSIFLPLAGLAVKKWNYSAEIRFFSNSLQPFFSTKVYENGLTWDLHFKNVNSSSNFVIQVFIIPLKDNNESFLCANSWNIKVKIDGLA